MKNWGNNNVKNMQVFEPAFRYNDDGIEHGVLSKFEPGTRILPKGLQIEPVFRPLPIDIVFEKDVAVTMRDGVTIYTDVFRPAGNDRVPVIVAWSPYGKSGGTGIRTKALFNQLGMDNGILSGLAKWEGPDPAYWCAHGYAICNPDARGIAHCEGDSTMIGTQEGQDCHDLIEWLAIQEWCNGKVGMSGTSYLAFSQWFAAAEQPPHLVAINPNEGLSDAYRDLSQRGGIPDLFFTKRLQINHVNVDTEKVRREDVYEEGLRYPLADKPVWQDKIAAFDKITVPAYIVASYSNTLHTAGTFRAWRRIASEDKWLRIHNSLEWPDYYDECNTEDRRRFFDYYLKGVNNGWENTPRVRYSLLDMEGGDILNLPAVEFPPTDVKDTKYFLDADRRTLALDIPSKDIPAVYDTRTDPGMISFITRFDRKTVMVGYPKVHLWVEADGADDMDLFVLIRKLDAHGNYLQQFVTPNQDARMHDLTENGASIYRYKGSDGRLRVSLRHPDKELSTDTIPEHTFDRIEKLKPGETVEVEIDLLPIGLIFYPGEQLQLVISGKNLLGGMTPGIPAYIPQNEGSHIIHTGGIQASYLSLPVKPI